MLYVEQLKIPQRLKAHQGESVIKDVGLGAAANALAAINTCCLRAKLRIVSIDCTTEPLCFALQHCDRLDYLREYAPRAGQLIALSNVEFTQHKLHVHWELKAGNFPALLPQIGNSPGPHAIFFDPFSPANNADMWTQKLFSLLFQRLDPGRLCALATYSRSTMVRVALLVAGFFVGRGRPSGLKEETTVAANRLDLIDTPLRRDWLKQVEKSRSAEPLHAASYLQAPLHPDTLKRLQSHPQFAGG
jgi:tRNA U34 5-methylaminomethyl-2-thiouridine-forming methyltransferase MnmC